MQVTYSEQGVGGIGYRLDIAFTYMSKQRQHAYTTNPDGSGLFFHNGRGDRRQMRGNGDFSARSMHQFKMQTQYLINTYRGTYPEVEDIAPV